MTSTEDVRSYERRIEREKELAQMALDFNHFGKLLNSAGRLLSLRAGLDEARYQMDKQECEKKTQA